jgi:glycine/D-amino acid oxidase-like deaminating enzyme
VFATGYESQRYLKQKIGDLHSTFGTIPEPLERFPTWPDRCVSWATARPYCYLRAIADGRILIGGKDTPYATAHQQEGLMKKKTMQLERRRLRMFPETDCEIAYAWAGTFGTTEDGLASIGPSSEWAKAYFALGYGGYGITMSVIAAELIPDHYLGQHNPDAELFRFAR